MAGRKNQAPGRGTARSPQAPRPSLGVPRQLTHDDVMQASVRVDPDLRRRSQLLWEDRTQPTRGPKRTVTPDDVVQAAVRQLQNRKMKERKVK